MILYSRMQLARQLSEISSEKQKNDSEISNLQKMLKEYQEKNKSFEEKLEDSNKQLDEVSALLRGLDMV